MLDTPRAFSRLLADAMACCSMGQSYDSPDNITLKCLDWGARLTSSAGVIVGIQNVECRKWFHMSP